MPLTVAKNKRAGGTVVVDGKALGQIARGMRKAALGSA